MAAASGTQNRCVFVGNIPYDATEKQLIQICEEVGPVVSFRLVLDKETGKPKGYGFCEYKDEETALSARRNLQGYEVNGRQLRVDFAENGKHADRNREQGRGGPGVVSKADAQNKVSTPSILGDSSLHQPTGLPLATNAATLMAKALGGGQTSVQTGVSVPYGAGSDALTHYLSRMSQHHLTEILSEVKTLATQNKELFSQLLEAVPQLSKALFQAEIMLGMVTPKMMQKAKGRQPSNLLSQSPTHLLQPHVQPDSVLPRSSGSLVVNIEQSQPVVRDPALSLPHVHQYTDLPQIQTYPQTVLGSSSIASFPPFQPQPVTVSSIQPTQAPAASVGLLPQGHLPLPPQHPRSSVFNAVQKLPQVALESVSSHSGANDSSWTPSLININAQVSDVAMLGAAQVANYLPELGPPTKLARLENGSAAIRAVSNIHNSHPASVLVGPSGASGEQMASAPVQQADSQVPQLAPEVESALLQQVLHLTPEQLRSLPIEQQQQVIELQKMLSGRK